MSQLEISVIIPTYNRRKYLEETLDSLSNQDLSAKSFEVIVVDDGSKDTTKEIAKKNYPFELKYISQSNQGDAIARNTGAKASRGVWLVFLDDDILVEPGYLAAILAGHQSSSKRIVVGKEFLWLKEGNPVKQGRNLDRQSLQEPELGEIEFVEVCSNNMSLSKEAYFSIGMMQNLDFPGSSMWCDVDFSYRAKKRGYEFLRSSGAICWHRDYVSQNMENLKKRWREASYRSVELFRRHPELITYLPMFYDMTPINWREDPPILILRKFARRISSYSPTLSLLEMVDKLLERINTPSAVMPRIKYWIIGGYIFRGYRDGLRDHLLVKVQ